MQDLADHMGDSLGLAPGGQDRRRRDRLLRRPLHGRDGQDPHAGEAVLIPDRRRLLARGPIPADRCARARPGTPARRGDVREQHRRGQGEDRLICTSSNAVKIVEQIGPSRARRRDPLRPRHVARLLRRPRDRPGVDDPERYARFHVWDGECHVHAGIRPADIKTIRAEHPNAEFLIHPECGCSTQAAGVRRVGRHLRRGRPDALHLGDAHPRRADPEGEFIVATENGMLYPLHQAAPRRT